MQNITNKTILAAFAVSALVGCKPNLKAPSTSAGNVDVSKYVALGNSITSGFADGALYYEGQTFSYAIILNDQFKTVGGGEFSMPYLPSGSVGVGSSGNAPLMLGYGNADCKGNTSLGPIPVNGTAGGDLTVFTPLASATDYNCVGVPGAKVVTAIFAGYGNPANGAGNYNPFFTRMLAPTEFASKSMLDKAKSQGHTFFTCFLGNNDVLGWATSGATKDPMSPMGPIPGVTLGFTMSYDSIINAMTRGGQKGAIANIPDVTSLPYFTTVPSRGLVLSAAQAAGLSAAYAPLGISFTAGANGFIIKDATAPGGMRKATANDYILLTVPQDSIKCFGYGSTTAIPDKYVLTSSEVAGIRTRTAEYNAKIKAVADAKGLAYVDANAFMAKAKSGIAYNGVAVSATFASGGAFSLDGIHLTPRGNALLANEFIKAINSTYGSSIREVEVTKYRGVKFP